METLDRLVDAALHRDAIHVRAYAQELLRAYPCLCELPEPGSRDPRHRSAAAAIVELLALRQEQPAPEWTRSIGELEEPFFLLQSAERMPRLRQLCEAESPEPLRRRKLYAPPEFLAFA